MHSDTLSNIFVENRSSKHKWIIDIKTNILLKNWMQLFNLMLMFNIKLQSKIKFFISKHCFLILIYIDSLDLKMKHYFQLKLCNKSFKSQLLWREFLYTYTYYHSIILKSFFSPIIYTKICSSLSHRINIKTWTDKQTASGIKRISRRMCDESFIFNFPLM